MYSYYEGQRRKFIKSFFVRLDAAVEPVSRKRTIDNLEQENVFTRQITLVWVRYFSFLFLFLSEKWETATPSDPTRPLWCQVMWPIVNDVFQCLECLPASSSSMKDFHERSKKWQKQPLLDANLTDIIWLRCLFELMIVVSIQFLPCF